MRMPQSNQGSLWSRSSAAGRLPERSLWGAGGSVALGDLAWGSSLGARPEELAGRCVLVATADQLTAALALIAADTGARAPRDRKSTRLNSSHLVISDAVFCF